MIYLQAGEQLKEIITNIRKLKFDSGFKSKDISTCVIRIKDPSEDHLLFYYHTKNIIEKQCKVELQFIIDP